MGYRLAPLPLTLDDLNRPRAMSQDFSIKYLEYGERHKVGHNGSQMGNHLLTCDWHYEF